MFAILIGMILALVIKKRDSLESGVKYTSKKILQYAVVLLGFGLNLEVVMETGKQSLPIIVCTITTSLVISYILHRTMNIPRKNLYTRWGGIFYLRGIGNRSNSSGYRCG